jgi:YggT family protein
MSEQLGFWLFTLPNYLLAAAMYTLMGRFLLSLVFKPNSELVIWRVFCQLTDPILHTVRTLTPAMVPSGLVMVLAIVWMLLLRLMLLVIILQTAPVPRG